jgi:hypothetical protein
MMVYAVWSAVSLFVIDVIVYNKIKYTQYKLYLSVLDDILATPLVCMYTTNMSRCYSFGLLVKVECTGSVAEIHPSCICFATYTTRIKYICVQCC